MKLQIINKNKIYKAEVFKIQKQREKFIDVDEGGNELKKDFIPSKTIFKDSKGNIVQSVYKLVNNQPRRKLKRTKEITNYKLVDVKKVAELIIESYYFVDCEPLKEWLFKEKKAIETVLTFGNGFRISQAYITIYKQHLLLILGFGNIDNEINKLLENYTTQETANKRNDSDGSNIERVDESELLEMYSEKTKLKKKVKALI